MDGVEVTVRRKAYAAEKGKAPPEVLRDVSFSLSPGEVVSLVGPSGCGKTTLLNLIAGLDPDYDGEISTPGDPSKPVGMVFQDARLLPWRTALENIVLAGEGIEPEKAHAVLEAVGLGAATELYPNRLSGGMQKRLALARALILEPSLLVLDEPFVSLDAPSAEALRILLLELLEQRPCATLFVTHDLSEAAMLSDRVLFLSASPCSVISEMTPPGKRGSRQGNDLLTFLDQVKSHPKAEVRALCL